MHSMLISVQSLGMLQAPRGSTVAAAAQIGRHAASHAHGLFSPKNHIWQLVAGVGMLTQLMHVIAGIPGA